MAKPLKLYVWDGIFSSMEDGRALALARSEEEARRLAREAVLAVYGEWNSIISPSKYRDADLAIIDGAPSAVYSEPAGMAFEGYS